MAIQATRSALMYNTFEPAMHTAPPVMFEPPGALTDKRHEVWIVAGGPTGWGGCHVWGSVDDATYDVFDVLLRSASVGALTQPLPADKKAPLHVDVAATHGVIHPGSHKHCDMLVTLCWVGGELVSHTEATLVGPHHYRLHGRVDRGCLGTKMQDHPVGTSFAKIDQSVFRFPYPAHWVGETLYAKFPSFNQFGLMLQDLATVPAYTVLLTGDSAK